MRMTMLGCVGAAALCVPAAASAAPCAGFTDVDAASPFCASVAWIRNRAITLGCTSTLYCPDTAVTRLQMAAFLNRLGDALFPPSCAVGQVMKRDAGGWSCAYDAAPIVLGYGGGLFTRLVSTTTPTTALAAGHIAVFSGDGAVAMPLVAPASVGGVAYQLASIEWCLGANTSNGAFVNAAVVYHDQAGAASAPLAVAVSDSTDRTTAGCYTLDVPALSPRGYSLALGLSGQTTNLTSSGVMLSAVKATWVPVTPP